MPHVAYVNRIAWGGQNGGHFFFMSVSYFL
jgi:hypothetical protein